MAKAKRREALKRALPYVIGGAGLLVVVVLILRNREDDTGEALPYGFGAGLYPFAFGGNAGSYVNAPLAGSVATPPSDPVAPGAPLTPAPDDDYQTLPCFMPPCPVMGPGGVIVLPPAGGIITGETEGGLVSNPGSVVFGPVPRYEEGGDLPSGGFVPPDYEAPLLPNPDDGNYRPGGFVPPDYEAPLLPNPDDGNYRPGGFYPYQN